MTRVSVDADDGTPTGDSDGPQAEEAPRARRPGSDAVEIERERTKQHLIDAISKIVVVILYMVFALMRDRDSGVVVLDEKGDKDDWDE